MIDEDIVVEVYPNFMTYGRYTVYAYNKNYKDDGGKITGEAYAQENMALFRWLGIGTSLEVQLKQATCDAIKDFKNNYAEYKKRQEFLKFLNDKAQLYAKNCPKDVV
jgi:hypothetical protein